MANSIITLYTREIGIEAEKLQMVEDFEAYLQSKATSLAVIETYQYQKIELNKYLKVDISQSFQSPLKDQNYIYCKIVNSDNSTRPIYYWIKKMNWKSSSCIELELVLDTLNTFKMGVDYTFSPKTIIQRQHKDRLEHKERLDMFSSVQVNYTGGSGYEIFQDNKLYVYNFTNKDDLFTAQEYQDIDENELNFDISNNNNRYLLFLYDKFHQKIIYGSENPQSEEYFEIHKVVSYLIYRRDYLDYEIVNSDYPVTANSLIFLALNADKAFVFENTDYTAEDIYLAIKLKVPSGTQFPMTWFDNDHHEIVDVNPDTYLSSIIFGSVSTSEVFFRKVDFTEEDLNPTLYHEYTDEENNRLLDGGSSLKWYLLYMTDTDTPTTIECYLIPETDIYVDTTIQTNMPVRGISSWDRTSARIIKLIEMPYVPYDFTLSQNGRIIIDGTNWAYNLLLQAIKLQGGNVDFTHKLNLSTSSPNNNLLITNAELKPIITPRDDFFESKMFHSDFYTLKYVYDSFALPYKYECVDMNSWFDFAKGDYPQIKDNITFKMANTFNSRFGFKFNDFKTGSLTERDYNNYLIIARNNEPPLFNSAYLDYIRTGFNYDVKNKNANNAKNWLMVGGSLAGTILSIVGAIATEGASTPLAVMAVSGTIATVGTLSNAIISTGQNERTINQKLTQLEEQSTNVSNADDLDLMNWYSSGVLHKAIYKVNERVEGLLKDLFYYYGYKDNRTGVPNTSTRIWFNYLKCEPILEFTSINMSQEIEDELKGIMRNGFTIIHKYNNTWDIEQVKENWEVSMLPYLS